VIDFSSFLQPLSGEPHVVIVLGKGGVGKTSVSLTIASELSELSDTLLVSFDPAKHIMEYLDLREPMKVVKVRGRLHACQLDIDLAAKEITSKYVDLLNEILPSLSVLNLEDVVKTMKYAPGVEEEVFLKRLLDIYRRSEFKYVVIDTPPTGISLRTLALPKLYMIWVEKLIEVRERIVSLRYVIAKTLGRKYEVDDPALKKLYEIREDYKYLNEVLKDFSRTSYVVVANPEPLPVHEMKEVISFLEGELRVKPKLLVLNKVLPKEVAVKLGVYEQQIKYVNEVGSMPYKSIMVGYLSNAPSKLDDIVKLKEASTVLRGGG